VIPFALLFAGGHGGFFGNATGNYTLDSNFTGISNEAEGVNRAIEQYIGAYALNTLGKSQKALSRKYKATSTLSWNNPSSNKLIDVYVSKARVCSFSNSMIADDKIETDSTTLLEKKFVQLQFRTQKVSENKTVFNF